MCRRDIPDFYGGTIPSRASKTVTCPFSHFGKTIFDSDAAIFRRLTIELDIYHGVIDKGKRLVDMAFFSDCRLINQSKIGSELTDLCFDNVVSPDAHNSRTANIRRYPKVLRKRKRA